MKQYLYLNGDDIRTYEKYKVKIPPTPLFQRGEKNFLFNSPPFEKGE